MGTDKRRVEVLMALCGEEIKVGDLAFSHPRGREISSFVYSDDWLGHPLSFQIDPSLPLGRAIQYPQNGNACFGCFSDASPDRWGRALMRRDAARRGQKITSLGESDYLLGVMDQLRPGAFRFRENGKFLSSHMEGVPKLKSINEFNHVIQRYLEVGELSDADMKDVLGPGTSLGGARPKLTLYDDENELFLVKFPNRKERFDAPLWEKVCLVMAEKCGISVPESRLVMLNDGKHALVVRRFDRSGSGRVHFASAMTMLGAKDSDPQGTWGYMDIAEVIAREGEEIDATLVELWKRMQFNVLVANRDDHLRNHAFIRKEKCWTLSPVYDLESDADTSAHSLCLTAEKENTPDPDLPVASSEYFGIEEEEAVALTKEMCAVIATFDTIAKKLGASQAEINLMQGSFICEYAPCPGQRRFMAC